MGFKIRWFFGMSMGLLALALTVALPVASYAETLCSCKKGAKKQTFPNQCPAGWSTKSCFDVGGPPAIEPRVAELERQVASLEAAISDLVAVTPDHESRLVEVEDVLEQVIANYPTRDEIPRSRVFKFSNAGMQSLSGTNSPVLISPQAVNFGFDTVKPSSIVISYSAECNERGAVGELDMLLDGRTLGSTGSNDSTNDRFCDGNVGTVTRVVAQQDVAPGSHEFLIKANGNFHLDDTDTVIVLLEK